VFDGIKVKMNGRKRYNCAMLLNKPHFAMFNFEFKNSVISFVILLRYKIKTAHKMTNISSHIFLK